MDAADDLLHSKLMRQRITPRKTTYMSCSTNARGRSRFRDCCMEPSAMIAPTRPAPPPPTRASFYRPQHGRDENARNTQDERCDNERASDPASRIWAKIRRASGLSLSHHRRNTSASTTASVAASVSLPFSSVACGTDSRALRRKKPAIEGGSLLMQRQRLAAIGSKQSLSDRTNLSNLTEGSEKRRSPKVSGKDRRCSGGRWGFGNWWLNS